MPVESLGRNRVPLSVASVAKAHGDTNIKIKIIIVLAFVASDQLAESPYGRLCMGHRLNAHNIVHGRAVRHKVDALAYAQTVNALVDMAQAVSVLHHTSTATVDVVPKFASRLSEGHHVDAVGVRHIHAAEVGLNHAGGRPVLVGH